jgi:hypothetical protein
VIGRLKNGQFKKGFHGRRRLHYARGRRAANFKHGRIRTTEYRTWAALWQRTSMPRNPNWKTYGGSGIQMCVSWRGKHGFEKFFADMGKAPRGTTLGRYLDSGNYGPGKCAWMTMSEQMAERMGRTAMRAWHEMRALNAETLRDWRGAFRGQGRRRKIKTLRRRNKKS